MQHYNLGEFDGNRRRVAEQCITGRNGILADEVNFAAYLEKHRHALVHIIDKNCLSVGKINIIFAFNFHSIVTIPANLTRHGVVRIGCSIISLGVDLVDFNCAIATAGTGRTKLRTILMERQNLRKLEATASDILERRGRNRVTRWNRDILVAADVRALDVRVGGGSYCAAMPKWK